MILTNRRHRLLTVALAGMEVAVIIPLIWLALFYIQQNYLVSEATAGWIRGIVEGSPLLFTLGGLLFWVCYALIADLINRVQIESPRRELILLAAILLTSLLLVRILLYPTASLLSLTWLANTGRAVFNFVAGWRLETLVILLNFFFWTRIVMATSRSLTFISVGLSFRMGFLVTIIGNAIFYGQVGIRLPLQYFACFIGFGLLAVALARIDEKSMVGNHSIGSLLPWSRAAMLGTSVIVTLAAGLLLARLYTPQNILTFFGWFSPLWRAIGGVLAAGVAFLLWLVGPLIDWLIETIRSWMEGVELFSQPAAVEFGQAEPLPAEAAFSMGELLVDWPIIQYGLVLLGLGLFGLFLWLFFVRPYLRQLSDEAEETAQEPMDWGLGGLRGGLDRLRNLANLVRRFGLSLDLLEAISVENMYANLTRIARQRGYPRQPNQPPDQYLPTLKDAFPNQTDGLYQITHAYMRVHYGEQTIGREELTRLSAAYELIQASSPDKIEPDRIEQ